VRQTLPQWETGRVWLEINHTETFLDHMDWKGEVTEVKCLLTFRLIITSILFKKPRIRLYAWIAPGD